MNLKCLLRGHHWGPLEGTDRGATHTCTYCGKTKHVEDPPPDAHDHLGINR
jgi:hypothetical protein